MFETNHCNKLMVHYQYDLVHCLLGLKMQTHQLWKLHVLMFQSVIYQCYEAAQKSRARMAHSKLTESEFREVQQYCETIENIYFLRRQQSLLTGRSVYVNSDVEDSEKNQENVPDNSTNPSTAEPLSQVTCLKTDDDSVKSDKHEMSTIPDGPSSTTTVANTSTQPLHSRLQATSSQSPPLETANFCDLSETVTEKLSTIHGDNVDVTLLTELNTEDCRCASDNAENVQRKSGDIEEMEKNLPNDCEEMKPSELIQFVNEFVEKIFRSITVCSKDSVVFVRNISMSDSETTLTTTVRSVKNFEPLQTSVVLMNDQNQTSQMALIQSISIKAKSVSKEKIEEQTENIVTAATLNECFVENFARKTADRHINKQNQVIFFQFFFHISFTPFVRISLSLPPYIPKSSMYSSCKVV